ncbi:MAG: biotin--[acetyl-CoA-carboxylase] ligase [bacterium]|nr:biotin--[acetyl-CoA-carboxylase] ligase [bacterium]
MENYHLQVLRGLDPGRGIPGRELSLKLGLSASAVAKSVGWLRTRKYRIEGGCAGGYFLKEAASSLYPWEVSAGLKTAGFGKKIHYFSELDSTNSLAFELALAGASEGEAVVAETQNRGRGRLDRVWISPPGVNIYASLILRPRVPMEQVAGISLLAGLALARACSRLWPVSPGLKWPNDVFLGDKKAAGILSEARTEGGEVRFVVCGIGINVNLDPGVLPGEVRARATSVAEFLGRPVSRLRLWRAFLEDFEEVYRGFLRRGLSPFMAEWDRRSILKGRRVKVSGAQEWEGEVAGLDPSGALRLNDREGKPRVVLAGDVQMLTVNKEEKCC